MGIYVTGGGGSNISSINGQTSGDVTINPSSIGAVDTNVLLETNAITGWVENDENITISFNDTTRTLTIAPISPETDFYFYSQGVKITKVGAQSIQIPNTTGLYYIYFDKNGVLHQSASSFFSDDSYVFVSIIYWNATQGKSVYVSEETHGLINRNLHLRLHSQGAVYKSGLVLGDYTLVGDGSDDSHVKVSLSNGEIMDDDILVPIVHASTPINMFEQVLSPTLNAPIINLVGTDFQINDATAYPVKMGSTAIQYNKNTAGTWSVVDAELDDLYVAMWVFATNDVRHPVFILMGQRTDSSLEDAQTNNLFSNLNFGSQVPFAEFKVLYRLIYQSNARYGNAVKAKLVDVSDQRAVTGIQVSAITTSSHSTLTNRSDLNSHPLSSISYSNIASGLTSDNGQDAIDELANEKADKVTSATPNNFAKLDSNGNLVDSLYNYSSFVAANVAITGGTNTKVTYDSKGLVTSATPATTADIADSTNKRYVTDAQLTVIGNTSNTNTGDEDRATIKTKLGVASSGVDGYLSGTDWTTFNGKQASLGFTPEDVSNKASTPVLGTSDTLYPTQKAVKTYVDTQVATKQNSDATLTALAALDSNTGFIVETAEDTFTKRNITGQSGNISVTYGDGVTANPLIDIGTNVVTKTGSQILTNKTIDADNNTISNINTTHLALGVIDSDLTSVSANHDTIPSAKAAKAYADTKEAALTKGNLTTTTTGITIAGNTTNNVIGSGTSIDIATANSSNTGLLSSTDWLTFNNKQSALGYTAESILNKASTPALGTSDILYPTQGAVKTYVDSGLSGKENTINLIANRAVVSSSGGALTVSTTTNTELGYVHGVTSAIQTQINAKQDTITGAATTITSTPLTANRAMVSNSNGKVAVSTTTDSELGYVSGVTSAIQTQLDNKAGTIYYGNMYQDASAGSAISLISSGSYYQWTNTTGGSTSGITYDNTNKRLVVNSGSAGTYLVTVNAAFLFSRTNTTCTVTVYKNGADAGIKSYYRTSNVGNMAGVGICGVLSLTTNDYLSLHFNSANNNDTVTVHSIDFNIIKIA